MSKFSSKLKIVFSYFMKKRVIAGPSLKTNALWDNQGHKNMMSHWSNLDQPITARCCLSIPLESIRKPKSFLMFSGCIDKQHRAVMG